MLQIWSVWPDWAIYWTLGKFIKSLAPIHLPKSPTLFGNFCKGVKIIHFSSEIIFGQLLSFSQRYNVPISRFSVPISRHSVPISRYSDPVSRYSVPTSRHSDPVSRYSVPISRDFCPYYSGKAELSILQNEVTPCYGDIKLIIDYWLGKWLWLSW